MAKTHPFIKSVRSDSHETVEVTPALKIGDFVECTMPYTTGAAKGRIIGDGEDLPPGCVRVQFTDGAKLPVHPNNLRKIEKR
jgi:hypothetical protein